MTRHGDEFVSLDDRVRIARDARCGAVRSRSTPTRCGGGRRTSPARRSTPARSAPPTPRRRASPRTRTPPTRPPASRTRPQAPGVADILFDLEATRDPRLRPSVLARRRRRAAGQDPAQPQPRALGRLRRAEGARFSLGAGRTRLSLQRQGRPGDEIAGVARRAPRPRWPTAVDRFFAPGRAAAAAARRRRARRFRPARGQRDGRPRRAGRRDVDRAGQAVIWAALHTSAAVPDDRMRRRRRRPHVPDNGRALG